MAQASGRGTTTPCLAATSHALGRLPAPATGRGSLRLPAPTTMTEASSRGTAPLARPARLATRRALGRLPALAPRGRCSLRLPATTKVTETCRGRATTPLAALPLLALAGHRIPLEWGPARLAAGLAHASLLPGLGGLALRLPVPRERGRLTSSSRLGSLPHSSATLDANATSLLTSRVHQHDGHSFSESSLSTATRRGARAGDSLSTPTGGTSFVKPHSTGLLPVATRKRDLPVDSARVFAGRAT